MLPILPLSLLLILIYGFNAQAAPSVVVSIKPIHSIVSSLMQDVAEPILLLESNESAHSFHIRPSQASALEKADLIISIGPNFEIGLANVLSSYNNDSQLVISQLDLVNYHLFRGSNEHNSEDDEHNDEHNDEDGYDYHLWLDVNNARLIAKHISAKLIEIDQENTATYTNNLSTLDNKLLLLHQANKERLSEFSSSNYVNYSDTLQYFEKSYNLSAPIIITPYHGARLSIHDVLNTKKKMQQQKAKCLLYPHEIAGKKIKVITEGVLINKAGISILGNELESGPNQYFELMNNLTLKIQKCL